MKTALRLSDTENKTNRRRFPVFIAALLAAALLLSSCGIIIINYPKDGTTDRVTDSSTDSGQNPDGTQGDAYETVPHHAVQTEDYETKAKQYLDKLTARNFNGLGVIIACADSEIWQAETDSGYAQAVSARNSAVREKYNVTLAVTKDSIDNILSYAKQAYKSGDYYADLISLPAPSLGAFAVAKLIGNARSLPFTDFSADYFDSDDIEQLSAGNFTYAVTGAATKKIDDMYGLLFNKEIVSGLGLASIYPQVYNGSWTWEVFLEYARAAADIDREPEENGSVSAFVSDIDSDGLLYASFASTGQTFMNTAYGTSPVRAFNSVQTEGIINVCNELKHLVSGDNTAARTAFAGNDTMFLLTKMTELDDYASAGFAWGVLPLPKYEENREYSTYAPTQTLLAVSSSTDNIDYAGLILQALNAASYGRIKYALNEKLKNEVISDTDTLSMLSIIYDGAYADFASSFSEASGAMKKATLEALKSAASGNNLTAIYSQTETALSKFLDSLIG